MRRMDRRLREKVTKQWGWIGDSDPREHAKARLLELDLDGSPLRGRPLPPRFRLGSAGLASYVASLGGPLPYMQRLRAIEQLIEEHLAELAFTREALAADCHGNGADLGEQWRAVAAAWPFHDVNALIEAHNRWFPAEARLPMDPRTGDFALVGGRPYRREPLGADWVLERFPPG